MRLAQLALEVALGHPDVSGASAGRGAHRTTAWGDHRLVGVSCVAESGANAYSIGLCLTARLTPLPALAADLRARIDEAAGRSLPELRVEEVDIDFLDLDVGPAGGGPPESSRDRGA